MTELMELPVSAIDADLDFEEEYRKEPFLSLLDDCIPFLSLQNLRLITSDIQEYIFSPDLEEQTPDLFIRYPSAQLVLSEFRQVFRSMVVAYQEKGLVVSGQEINPSKNHLYVQEIVQLLNRLLYRRLICYAAGLDIDFISALSATKYESKGTKGQTIAILPSHQWFEKNAVMMFAQSDCIPLEQSQLRALRKQLNICGDGALAVCKDENTGTYVTRGLISQEAALTLPRFHFQNHAEWFFAVPDSNGRGDRLRYCNGTLMLPILNLRDVYQKHLSQLPIKAKCRKRLAILFDAANECQDGAILIVSSKEMIEKEVTRLGTNKRGTRLSSPMPLTKKGKVSPLLKQFAAVDGAIFLDFDGNCHAYGVILDGVVSNPGDNARGSRFNSTKAYTEWVRDERYPGYVILGVVKSEDGMLDLFDKSLG